MNVTFGEHFFLYISPSGVVVRYLTRRSNSGYDVEAVTSVTTSTTFSTVVYSDDVLTVTVISMVMTVTTVTVDTTITAVTTLQRNCASSGFHLGCFRIVRWGWVSSSLFPIQNQSRPHEINIYLLWEKVAPNAAFHLIFLGLGCPWVGEFVGFILLLTCFPPQHDLVNRKHPLGDGHDGLQRLRRLRVQQGA